MKRSVACLVLWVATLGSAACYRTTLNFKPNAEPFPVSSMNRYFAVGLISLSGPVNLDGICPGGVARVEQRQGIYALASYWLSGGTVDARTAEIYCEEGGSVRPSRRPVAGAPASSRPADESRAAAPTRVQRFSGTRKRIKQVGLKCAAIPMRVEDVSDAVAFVVDELLLGELQQVGFEAIGPDDIQAMIGFEKVKDAAGCDSATCIAEIGNALGVDHLVAGSFASLGDAVVLTLKLLDVRRARVIARATSMNDGGEAALPMMIAEAVQDLIAQTSL